MSMFPSMVPRSSTPSQYARRPKAINVKGLLKRYGDATVLDGIDLDVRRGECFGLLGPNGAGKTTMFEILEGLNEPTSGDVEVLGMRWATHAAELRQKVGVALQQTHFSDPLTVRETVRLFRSFYKSGRAVDDILARVYLTEKQHVKVRNLSGGQHQRLALACALVSNPELLFLDEPTTGLDPQSRRALWELIIELKALGNTIMLSTHYMDEAERICDRIAIIDGGKVVAQGTSRELIDIVGPGGELVEIATRPVIEPSVLEQLPSVVSVRAEGQGAVIICAAVQYMLPALFDRLEENKHQILHLAIRHASLEDTFVQLTGRKLREE